MAKETNPRTSRPLTSHYPTSPPPAECTTGLFLVIEPGTGPVRLAVPYKHSPVLTVLLKFHVNRDRRRLVRSLFLISCVGFNGHLLKGNVSAPCKVAVVIVGFLLAFAFMVLRFQSYWKFLCFVFGRVWKFSLELFISAFKRTVNNNKNRRWIY